MSINLDTLKKIANMAHIELGNDTSAEHDKLVATLANIQTLQTIDTTDTEAFTHKLAGEQTLRNDEATTQSNLDALAAIASNFQDDSYQVPNVLADSGE